jgi:hypothetical protein
MAAKGRPRRRASQPVLDPRRGDIEDDASSTKRRSMLSLAGSLLVEISLPKLMVAWVLLLVVPGLLLGFAPIAVSFFLGTVTDKLASVFIGFWSVLILAALLALAWFGWRTFLRLIEQSFWSLNSIIVQPGYAAFREGLRHLAERLFARKASEETRAKLRSACAALAGLAVFGLGLLVVRLAWPYADLFGNLSEVTSWMQLASVALANSAVVVVGYLAFAALAWGFADAMMAQPRGLSAFPSAPQGSGKHRVVHLSDVHVVGERYGFRIESGRSGARGNDRFRRLLDQLERIHARAPLDTILITGDMTDAGISTEWAEFLDALAEHPRLASRVLMLPGNHDLNIVDRANPARMDLPTSPNRRLRQIRALAAMNAVQGERVRTIDRAKGRLGKSAVAGDGGDQRHGHGLLYPHAGRLCGWAQPHQAGADRRQRREDLKVSQRMVTPTGFEPVTLRLGI